MACSTWSLGIFMPSHFEIRSCSFSLLFPFYADFMISLISISGTATSSSNFVDFSVEIDEFFEASFYQVSSKTLSFSSLESSW